MLATYAATLVTCGSALLIGQALLAACGWRRSSWLAPVVGLGPAMALAWGAIQLPGEGATALAAILAASALSLVMLLGRVEGGADAVREGFPVAVVALAIASIPFAFEGRFGVLGTGFNVDMSQHLFAAQWLAAPTGAEPGLVKQGYPLGPHALAVAAAEPGGGNLVHGFGGMTIAVPVLASLCALTVLRSLPPVRRTTAAVIVGLPYMVASYLAQGQFKELLQGLFLLGFALCLHRLSRGWAAGGPARMRALAAVPLAAIALGSLYSYSAPGLAWLGGAALVFAAAELVRRRRSEASVDIARRAALPLAVGLGALLLGAAPEVERVVDFQSNAARVADLRDGPSGARGTGGSGAPVEVPRHGGEARISRRGTSRFDDELGNLFGHISPLPALGIWPSGDFRVLPGDGEAPAIAFYAGAAIGAVALLLGLAGWLRRGETALPAALLAAVGIYVAARTLSTPYAAAKGVMMIAPLAMLISLRELLSARAGSASVRSARGLAGSGLVAAFVAGAAGSSLLALGKAPVGPDDYSPGLARMRSAFEGKPTLVLADRGKLDAEHARDFLGWEARGGDPLCIEPAAPWSGAAPPEGVRYVVTTEGEAEPPFAGFALERSAGPYTVWRHRGPARGNPPEADERGDPTDCPLEPAGDERATGR